MDKNFSYLALLAKKAETAGSVSAQLRIAEQMQSLLRSAIVELKIAQKKEKK
jgi:hypothetical protein